MDFNIAVSTQLVVNTFMFVYTEIALVIHKQADFVNAKHAHLEMNTFEHMLRYSCIWMARYICVHICFLYVQLHLHVYYGLLVHMYTCFWYLQGNVHIYVHVHTHTQISPFTYSVTENTRS